MDFTIKTYSKVLEALMNSGYEFQRFDEFMQSPAKRAVVLRHDVDLLPQNSLRFAQIQADLNIKGSYYFRAVPQSWDEAIITEIAKLNHEIGYHYENLTTTNGNYDLAIQDFDKNLAALRKLAPVTTICMHGSPMSRFDSKDLWKKYQFADYGILAEPYFDVNYNEVLYFTDTGRMWNADKSSIRDKVKTNYNFDFKSSNQVIEGINSNSLPDQIMFTFHPQRWSSSYLAWAKEYVMQNVKNVVKRYLYNQS